MSRIGQYIIEQEERGVTDDIELPEGDQWGLLTEDYVRSFADPAEVEAVLKDVAGLESFPPMPDFIEESDELILSLGNEDFRDQVDRLWQKIKRWLKALMEWLDQTLDVAAVSLAILKETIRQTQFDMNLPGSSPKGTGTLSMRKHVGALSVRYKPLADISQITSALEILQTTTNSYYAYVDKDLRGNLTNALSLLTTKSSNDPDLVSTLIKCSPIRAVETMKLKEQTTGGGGHTSKQLLGNLRFVARYPNHDITRVTQFQGVSLLLDHAELAPKDVPPQIVIPRFNYVASRQCLNRLMLMVTDLENATTGDIKTNHRKMINSIEATGERLRTQLGRGNDEDVRQRIMMTQRLIFWMTKPYRGIVTHTMRSMRGAVTLCRLNQQ